MLIITAGSLLAQEKWTYSADELEQITIKDQNIRRLKKNVRFLKKDKVLLTDNAIQFIKQDVLHLNGNTMLIDGLDTLTCDSMYYWSKLDSGYAMGNVRFIQPDRDRTLTTEFFHYWKTDGYRGSSFISSGYTRIMDADQLIIANKINYEDHQQLMKLAVNASVENPTRGIFGDEITIQYADSMLEVIRVKDHAFAYNDLNLRIYEDGPYQKFRDEMTSKEMIAYFSGDQIIKLDLMNMASTMYHVVSDSLLAGENEASGDTIAIDFQEGDIKRIQVTGGARGEFKPEGSNTKIDTTIIYGADYIDYHIDEEMSFLSNGAFVEYQNTRLSAGKIVVNWQTNILDAILLKDEYPTVKTNGEEPMRGNSMVFDLISKHGRIDKGRTTFNQGFYHGREVFRDDPNIFHVTKSKYTSCDLDNPHFYMGSRNMKMLPGDRVIAKPLWLFIYDIPVIGIPLAVFPNKGGKRHSGWIMPSFDSYKSIGTGFRNFGYYWAPNDYLDKKVMVNFFDEQGIHIRSFSKYKKRNGFRWYNFQYNGNLKATIKRTITNDEITNLLVQDSTDEIWTVRWNHNQHFDPTQRLSIKYDYVSSQKAYDSDQEVDLQNRLKQNLSSSFNYSKNWQMSSFSIGFNEFRDLSLENNPPSAAGSLYDNRYKSYKYRNGPNFNFRIGTRKIFGVGDSWYNSLTSSYTMKTSMGRKDYWLIKNPIENSWLPGDTTKLKHGGIKHSSQLSSPQNFFGWLTLNPNISLREDWIFSYKNQNEAGKEEEVDDFKRRLTWETSLSAKTKIYGLFPITIGRLNAIRHVITPGVSFNYRPDFSNPKFGGDLYFQNNDSEDRFDYFKGSYVGSTSQTEKKTYRLTVNNVFQSKIRKESGIYEKINFLTWFTAIDYNTVKESFKLSELRSSIRVKNPSGGDLFKIGMNHNFYKLDSDKTPIDELLLPWKGENPRLTRMDITTSMKIKLIGNPKGNEDESIPPDTTVDLEEEFYSIEQSNDSKINRGNIWDTKFQFNYRGNWEHKEENWDYTFTLKTISSFKLSQNWTLSYIADFNIKEREMTYHSFKFYRPLHCWEFSFNWWPRGKSSGFSLRINVKNPDLQDIKLTSSDNKRGFGS